MLIYAERLGNQDKGEPYIAERGVFSSVEEFAPYRANGWTGTTAVNAAADKLLESKRGNE
ncbi:MAG: hypothetical protein ABFC88_13175 [Thermoguttaceae bacterium]